MSACHFCGYDINRPEVFAESPVALALLSDDHALRGHAVVVAKRHVENLSSLSEQQAGEFVHFFRRVEEALLAVTGADRAILLKLGLQVPHLHLHIYPVSRAATRAEVMDAIEMESRVAFAPGEEEELLETLRQRMTTPPPLAVETPAQIATRVWEEAGMSGLCAEGRFEAVVDALRERR
ncbi:MAG: HIT domain-containing protein [Thermoanaerobaculia bacterium]